MNQPGFSLDKTPLSSSGLHPKSGTDVQKPRLEIGIPIHNKLQQKHLKYCFKRIFTIGIRFALSLANVNK